MIIQLCELWLPEIEIFSNIWFERVIWLSSIGQICFLWKFINYLEWLATTNFIIQRGKVRAGVLSKMKEKCSNIYARKCIHWSATYENVFTWSNICIISCQRQPTREQHQSISGNDTIICSSISATTISALGLFVFVLLLYLYFPYTHFCICFSDKSSNKRMNTISVRIAPLSLAASVWAPLVYLASFVPTFR